MEQIDHSVVDRAAVPRLRAWHPALRAVEVFRRSWPLCSR